MATAANPTNGKSVEVAGHAFADPVQRRGRVELSFASILDVRRFWDRATASVCPPRLHPLPADAECKQEVNAVVVSPLE
eukprot:6213982-Pleurochrysis_carterae.AAC.2